MKKFITASIGSKFLMSITGLFMITFIAVHLTVNLLLIFDDTGELFNRGAHFMATTLPVKIMEPILGLGFLIHILWSFVIEYKNLKARPVSYARRDTSTSLSWASRNMIILGLMILIFLVIHLMNFFWVIKFNPELLNTVNIKGEVMEDTYTLVSGLFKSSVVYGILYILGGTLLGLHLSHGFWSAFHTLGLTGEHWIGKLQFIGIIYAIIVAVGFSIIPLYFLIKF
ncbi:MAG: succinate dehydrogenase cytochrome b subunit [Prolixibacteraceae bacterium]|nr:succinate dehydrogenase cytochrome b subunit [Prolixibacteraceae bacterium]